VVVSIHQKKLRELERERGKPGPLVQSHGSDQAPFLYFENAVAFGVNGGVVQIELAANVVIPVTINGKSEVRVRSVVVGHLRATHATMALLADAIEKALMITGPLDRNAMPEKAKEKVDDRS
jgi:hypothetical protein